MSIRAIVWAFDQECPTPAAKLVLIKLADHSNDDGECWPSQGRVAKDCGLTRETVNRQVKALAAVGLLEIHHQMNGSGQMANRYRLRCDNKSHPPVISDHSPSDDRSHPPVISDHTEPSLITVIEPSKENAREARSVSAEFEEWWKGYPHKVGKGAAEPKFMIARKKASFEELCDGVRRYVAAKPADHPWCNPATWLHQKRWTDHPAYSQEETNGHDRFDYAKPSRPLTPELRQQYMAQRDAEEEVQGSRH